MAVARAFGCNDSKPACELGSRLVGVFARWHGIVSGGSSASYCCASQWFTSGLIGLDVPKFLIRVQTRFLNVINMGRNDPSSFGDGPQRSASEIERGDRPNSCRHERTTNGFLGDRDHLNVRRQLGQQVRSICNPERTRYGFTLEDVPRLPGFTAGWFHHRMTDQNLTIVAHENFPDGRLAVRCVQNRGSSCARGEQAFKVLFGSLECSDPAACLNIEDHQSSDDSHRHRTEYDG